MNVIIGNTKAVHGWKFTLVALFPISGLFSVSSFVKLRNGNYNAGSFLGMCIQWCVILVVAAITSRLVGTM